MALEGLKEPVPQLITTLIIPPLLFPFGHSPLELIEQCWKDWKCNGKLDHTCSTFPAQVIGYSHGGGQIELSNTKHFIRNLNVLNAIVSNPTFQCISGIANSAHKRYRPNMYEHLKENDEALHLWKLSLCRNFPKSVFAATTINSGKEGKDGPSKDLQRISVGPGGQLPVS
ncbi:hypothetical protein BT96DRAFT_1005104 [Gymnopus androsaceus JB14]|uniref:Uncharacterized protein n=1 Tax=Gymnopus androsaceus JB14 TaxID=1447944 RepID=A0A6A4GNS4_9AGAR|nr:hypothetical protein BT96DRAFT_1005104 [Gymnopus androsaceus JB14]